MLVALLASGGSALTLHAAAPSAARGVFGGVSRCAVARMDLVRQVKPGGALLLRCPHHIAARLRAPSPPLTRAPGEHRRV